jgi:hypothetical protein
MEGFFGYLKEFFMILKLAFSAFTSFFVDFSFERFHYKSQNIKFQIKIEVPLTKLANLENYKMESFK